jgi:hypothetical protein
MSTRCCGESVPKDSACTVHSEIAKNLASPGASSRGGPKATERRSGRATSTERDARDSLMQVGGYEPGKDEAGAPGREKLRRSATLLPSRRMVGPFTALGSAYAAYYQRRPHRPLGSEPPVGARWLTPGRLATSRQLISSPILGGLHSQYAFSRPLSWRRTDAGRLRCPRVTVVQAANAGKGDDSATGRRFNGTRDGRVTHPRRTEGRR